VKLYLDPPAKAVVLCVDEKPSIQPLERAHGYLKMPNGCALTGQSHDYVRHGTTTLFAALDVSTGKIAAAHAKRRRRLEFLAFMDRLVKAYPGRQWHAALDNRNTHKKNEAWLAPHPNVKFHDTPTHASRLNQIEIWFSIHQGQTLCMDKEESAPKETHQAYHSAKIQDTRNVSQVLTGDTHGDAVKFLALGEDSLDEVAPYVDVDVGVDVEGRDLLRTLRDNDFCAALVHLFDDRVGVERLVGRGGVESYIRDQGRDADRVEAKPRQHNQAHEIAQRISQGEDFRRPAAFGFADRLIFKPP
jgi:hypothetical protein